MAQFASNLEKNTQEGGDPKWPRATRLLFLSGNVFVK